MTTRVAEGFNYTRFTANGNVSLGDGQSANLFGILASNGNSAGLTVVDVGNGNATIANNVPLTSGSFIRMPCTFTRSLALTFSIGADVTVFWAPK